MGEWKEIEIKDLGRVITGNTPSKNHPEDWGINMPFITPSDYKSYFKVAKRSERNLSQIGIEKLKKKILPPNSVLVTCIGSDMGKVILNQEEVITNQQINSIVIDKALADANFIYYYLINEKESLKLLGSDGTAVPILNKSDFEKIRILLPPLPEQNSIASVLSSLDDKIDLLHRQNATLEMMAETLFRQWFVEEAKEEWEIKPLSSIAQFLNGLACQKFTPKNITDRLPVLKIKELSSGISDNSDWASTDINPNFIVNNGDVIFAWSASLMVKIWNGEDCILNQHLFKVTSNDFPKWFYFLWCKHHLTEFISISASHATTMGHIKRGDLDEALVLIPTKKELLKMTEQVEPLIEKQIHNNKQIHTLTSLRDTLLPKLMSGEVKVKT